MTFLTIGAVNKYIESKRKFWTKENFGDCL